MHACKAVTDRDELDFLFWRKIVITRALIPLKGSHFKLFFTRRHIDQTPCFVKPSQTGPCILAITRFRVCILSFDDKYIVHEEFVFYLLQVAYFILLVLYGLMVLFCIMMRNMLHYESSTSTSLELSSPTSVQ